MKSKELIKQLKAAKVENNALVSLMFSIELFATRGFKDYLYKHDDKCISKSGDEARCNLL